MVPEAAQPAPPPQPAGEQPQADVQIFALGDAPTSVVALPVTGDLNTPSETPGTTSGGQQDEILQEAQRVGATGDVAGQISLLEQAGYMGNAEAFYALAKIYLTGVGVEKAPEAAVGYLNSAMGLGHAESTRVLGWLYVMGSGVGKDVSYGESLLAKSAETSVRAQREFGMALTNQRIPHLNDMERGLEYLRTASASGDAESTKAYATAFTPQAAGAAVSAPSAAMEQPAQRRDDAAPRQSVQDGGESLEARGRHGDLESVYQYALNASLGRVKVQGDPQFTAYCWYSVAAARGYAPAVQEVKSLAGVKILADKQRPGSMEACIAGLNADIDGY